MSMVEILRKSRLIKREKTVVMEDKFIEIQDDFTPLFVFLSDTHLNAHQYNLSQRPKDLLAAFDSCLTKSQEILGENGVVIHGGDVFNSPNVRPSAIIETMKMLLEHTVKVYALRGNHDGSFIKAKRNDITLKLLEETGAITYLESRVLTHFFDGVAINFIFQSYMGKKTMAYLEVLTENLDEIYKVAQSTAEKVFNVLVIHDIVEGVSMGANLSRREFKAFLEKKNISLALCGHLHTRTLDPEIKILHVGSPECLDIDQADEERGFFVIGTENNQLGYQWIPIQTRPMRDISIEVGDVSTVDLNTLLKEKIVDLVLEEGTIVRFTIHGTTTTLLQQIDKKIFSKQFPGMLKIFVKNVIKYIKEEVDRVEMLSLRDAIKCSLGDIGIEEERITPLTDAMMEVLKESSERVEGWRTSIRHIIHKLIEE